MTTMRNPTVDIQNASVRFPVGAGVGRGPGRSTAAGAASPSAVVGGRVERGWRGRGAHVWALDDVSVSVAPGERIGLIGRNGSGKTTLLRVMGGQLTPHRGNAHIRGVRLSLFSLKVSMDANLSGRRNITLFARLMGLDRDQQARLGADVEQFAQLGEFIDLPVRTYSAGMSMRLAFGLYTGLKTDILLVDEVIGAGDRDFQKRAAQRLRDTVSTASIFVLATHSQHILVDYCTRALVLDSGRVVFDGGPEEAWAFHERNGAQPSPVRLVKDAS